MANFDYDHQRYISEKINKGRQVSPAKPVEYWEGGIDEETPLARLVEEIVKAYEAQ